MTGTIKHLQRDRGFCFIAPDGGGPDVFCHATKLVNRAFSLIVGGERVEFTAVEDMRRPGMVMAVDVLVFG